MSGSTTFYGLTYFTYGDDLDDGMNVAKERDRFIFIDKQLYGLYNVFGDGVISGWEISTNPGNSPFSIGIAPGYGFLQSQFAQTESVEGLDDLPPNSVIFVYGEKNNDFLNISRDVLFSYTVTPVEPRVYLARVTTDANGIVSIDYDIKKEISFLQFIRQEVATHKHRGSPSKIDLQTETKNQLQGARVQDFDAAKITSGKVSPERIPQLDHGDLKNTGLLNHAALDSFTRLISSGNRQLLGEVSAVNTMKLITTQHYLASLSDLNLSDIVDFTNLHVCYPGITPDAGIDFQASTANINLKTNCISGKPVPQGSVNSIFYDSNSAFVNAYDRKSVSIAKNTVTLTKGGTTATQVENFEQVAKAGVAVPTFSVTTQILNDNIKIVSDDTPSRRTQGFYSGKFSTDRDIRILYTKRVQSDNDWTNYDELVLDVKSLSISHGAVYMYLVNTDGDTETKSSDFLVLGADEITDNFDADLNGFERRIFDIGNATKDNVTAIVFYTDDAASKQIFWIDNIFIRSQSLYPTSGYIRFRQTSSVSVLYNSITYVADIPDGCDVRVRARTALSANLLDRATYTLSLNSGDVFAQNGTDIEIDVVLVSSPDRTRTPTLKSIELQYIVTTDTVGFNINNSDSWNRGTYVNQVIERDVISTTEYNLKLASPVSVGDIYYTYQNGVNQNDPRGLAVTGFRGMQFRELISPVQAYSIVENNYRPGFYNPYSVYRSIDKNYLIADTFNDRVIETTISGEFVRGLGGHNIEDTSAFYPLTAVFNPRNSRLTICFSQAVNLENFDITKIKLWIGSASLNLGSNDTLEANGKNGKILELLLSNDKAEQMQDRTTIVYVDFITGVFNTPIVFPTGAKKLVNNRGLPVFIGDFSYVNDVVHPVYANKAANGDWIICNAKITQTEVTVSDTRRITVTVGQATSFISFIDIPLDPETNNPVTGYTATWDLKVPSVLTATVTRGGVETSTDGKQLQTTIFINQPDTTQIGVYQLLITITDSTGGQETTTVVLTIQPESIEPAVVVESPDLLQINQVTEALAYSYNGLQFSDFTLGSAFEIDDNQLLISGIYAVEDDLPKPEGSPEEETFEQQAVRKLTNYAGKTIIINRSDNSINFEYNSSDNSYPSDAVLDENNLVVVAETSFIGNAGRVIKIDGDGNIVWQLSNGLFSKINDVRAKLSGDVIIST